MGRDERVSQESSPGSSYDGTIRRVYREDHFHHPLISASDEPLMADSRVVGKPGDVIQEQGKCTILQSLGIVHDRLSIHD